MEGGRGGRYGGKVSRRDEQEEGGRGRKDGRDGKQAPFFIPPPRKTSKQEVDGDDDERMKKVGSPTAVIQSGDGKGGRGREDGAKESKFSLAGISFISRAAANTCLGMQAGEPLTTARCDVTKGSYAFGNGGTRCAASEMWKKKQQNFTGFKV